MRSLLGISRRFPLPLLTDLIASPHLHGLQTFLYTQRRAVTTRPSSENEEEIVQARSWFADFDRNTIPRNIAQIRYDRSSGAGGQHVNTTDSKATATWSLKDISDKIPKLLHKPLEQSRYYAKSSKTIVVQAQSSRKRTENENECYEKFHQLLLDIGNEMIPGETSVAQHARVVKLQKKDNENRLKSKKQHSDKKKSRKSGDY